MLGNSYEESGKSIQQAILLLNEKDYRIRCEV